MFLPPIGLAYTDLNLRQIWHDDTFLEQTGGVNVVIDSFKLKGRNLWSELTALSQNESLTLHLNTSQTGSSYGIVFVKITKTPLCLLWASATSCQDSATQELIEQRDQLRLILDSAPFGIWMHDAKGKMLFVNKAVCEAIGMSEEQFLSVEDYTQIIPELYHTVFLSSDSAAVTSDHPVVTQEKLVLPNGEIQSLAVIKAVKRNESNEPIYLVGLAIDTSKQFRQEAALRETQKRMRQLILTGEKQLFDERRRIAQSLHDDLGQLLTALHLLLSQHAISPENKNDCESIFHEALSLIDECIKTTRRVTSTLKPPPVLELGLIRAVHYLIQQLSRTTDVQISFSSEGCDEADSTLPPDIALGAYRLFQEGLTNSLRYSHATTIKLRLEKSDLDETLIAIIEDNGRGIDPDELPYTSGLGLSGLSERATAVGGKLEMKSQPNFGTTLVMTLPLPRSTKNLDVVDGEK